MKQARETSEFFATPAPEGSGGRLGRIMVAPEVLLTIVRQAATSQPGVVRLSQRRTPRRRGALRGRVASAEGVRLEIGQDNQATVDVRLVVSSQVNVRELAQALQAEVARALQTMVDMKVREVNVHVEDVELGAGA